MTVVEGGDTGLGLHGPATIPPSEVCEMGYRCSGGIRVAFLMDFWRMFRLNKLGEEKQ